MRGLGQFAATFPNLRCILVSMTQARNPAVTKETQKQIEELDSLGWYHSIELPDGRIIKGLQSVDRLRSRLAQFPG